MTNNTTNKTILIIEDEPSLTNAYKQKLHDLYTLNIAVDASQASQILRTKVPDLIILDIMLPGGKNGYDILREIRQNPKTTKIPTIIITNLPESERETAMTEGATEYLLKTETSLDQLVQIIKKYI